MVTLALMAMLYIFLAAHRAHELRAWVSAWPLAVTINMLSKPFHIHIIALRIPPGVL